MREKNDNKLKSRRKFLNNALLGGSIAWVGAIIYPVYNYLKPPKENDVKVSSVSIGKVEDMKPNNGKIIKFGNKPVLVVRKPSGEYAAFDAVCTHLDCLVQYKSDLKQIYCACHNGRYQLDGKVISGPPPAPLEKYSVLIKGEEVIVHKEMS